MTKNTHAPRRDSRFRQRLFDAGNTKCPICLADFDRSDVVAGTEVTLEHAPPKSLGGAPICLTCKSCNNNSSLIDQHAYLSVKAKKEWATGVGAPIEIDLFGHKKSYRFVPHDPNSPFPARKNLLRNGTIDLGSLPPKQRLDRNKGISFKIPQRDDYEFVSMIKSAYLMVFSLMGANGYKFAENIGLRPVREQIMNPKKKILEGGFVGTIQLESEDLRKLGRSVVFLCRAASPPFWIIPLWNDKAVLLSCGGMKPIDKLVVNEKEFSIPTSSLVGWVSRRFSGSSAMSGTVDEEPSVSSASLAGAIGGPMPTNRGGWLYVVVFHQSKKYIALPFCHDNDQTPSDAIPVIDMLSEQEVSGRNLDRTELASTSVGSWTNDVPITAMPIGGEENDESET